MFDVILMDNKIEKVNSKYVKFENGNYYFYDKVDQGDTDCPVAIFPEREVIRIKNNKEKN